MKALYLYIEYQVGTEVDALLVVDIVRKESLVVVLFTDETAENFLIVRVFFKLLKPAEVGHPAVTFKKLGYLFRQTGVAERKPAALSYTVGLVAEAFGVKAEPVCKNSVLQYLCVYLGNSVYM